MMIRFTRLIRFTLGVGLVLAAFSTPAWANEPIPTPEIDPGMMTSALALLGGGLLLITNRSRRK